MPAFSSDSLTICCIRIAFRFSAVRPNERMAFVAKSDNFINSILTDSNVTSFGLHEINPTPMQVPARLLPPATLKYGGGKVGNFKILFSN